ncbi:hypothetical protein FNV43_RR05806 [Rhamnella rubrinervis]|uniref:Uncharacterized protein n=1 Tax=Rhamnella rubrinervis TaxID=2594499 RepID=A0A8K0HPH8_9ROSA|nr:hypothetical protein FNV43_RR05806 [Rhamnella rubrinervis]
MKFECSEPLGGWLSSIAAVAYNKKHRKPDMPWNVVSKTLAAKVAWKFVKEKGIDMVTINPAMLIGPLLQPTLNTSSAAMLNLINGAQTFPNSTFGWINMKKVAIAHILAYEIPSANGRYCLVNTVAHYLEVMRNLRELYPDFQLPQKQGNSRELKGKEVCKLPSAGGTLKELFVFDAEKIICNLRLGVFGSNTGHIRGEQGICVLDLSFAGCLKVFHTPIKGPKGLSFRIMLFYGGFVHVLLLNQVECGDNNVMDFDFNSTGVRFDRKSFAMIIRLNYGLMTPGKFIKAFEDSGFNEEKDEDVADNDSIVVWDPFTTADPTQKVALTAFMNDSTTNSHQVEFDVINKHSFYLY